MGRDLYLLPIKETGSFWLSHSVLEVERRYVLFDEIGKIPQFPIQIEFCSFVGGQTKQGNTCYGDAREDPYGDPVKWVHAKDLVALAHMEESQSPFNRPIWAFLGQLPPEQKVALYWH